MLRSLVLALLRCGDVRPDCAVLGYFEALCVAGVGGLAARFLAAFLCLHFVYPPSNETRETA